MIKITFTLVLFCNIISSQHRLVYSPYSDTVTLNSTVNSQVDSIFRTVLSHGNLIEFEDCNICKSRAHIMCRVIENNFPTITTSKAWLFADCSRRSQRDKYRYKPFVYLTGGNGCRSWMYHVAPVIITSTDTFVIDPSTQTSPVLLSQWADKLIPTNGEGYIILKDKRYFIYPDDSNDLFEDEKIVWQEENEMLTDDEYSRSIDEMVRTSLGLVEPWKMNERVQALKKLINPR